MTNFILTDRDRLAVRWIARFRVMDSDLITTVIPGSPNHFRRRLRQLTDHKYLERLYAHAISFADLRSRPRVYALGQAGARLLTECDGIPLDHLEWQVKNARAGHVFVNHTLGIAGTMIAVLRAAEKHNWQVVDHFDLRPSFPVQDDKRRKRNPFSLTVHYNSEGHPVVPDRLFSLHRNEHRLNFALEVDMGSMPVHRSFFDDGTAITNKIRLYWQAWIDKAHQEAWAFKQFRVLFVMPSDERIATVQKRVAKHKLVSNPATQLFLLTTPERLQAQGPFAPIWQTITPGEPLSLLASVPQPTTSIAR